MTFQELSYFLAVYEERSITAAARRLFISQQSLSAHIQHLEEDCGTALFVRRPVFSSTYAGDRLAEIAREILRLKKEVLAEIQEIEAGRRGKMTLGFSGFLAGEHLPELLRRFYEVYPGIEVSAVTSDSSQLEEQTMDGRLDFYIGSTVRKNSEIVARPLIEVTLIVAVREHVLRECGGFSEERIGDLPGRGVTLKELEKTPLILPFRGWRVREPIDRYIKTHKLRPNIVLEANQMIAVSACEKGIGASILYSVTPVGDGDEGDRILRIPLRDIGYTIQSCICCRRDHYLTAHEEEFIRLTKEYFGS